MARTCFGRCHARTSFSQSVVGASSRPFSKKGKHFEHTCATNLSEFPEPQGSSRSTPWGNGELGKALNDHDDDRSWVALGPILGRSRVDLLSISCRCWGDMGIRFSSIWGRCWVDLGSIWSRFGVDLGSMWGQVWGDTGIWGGSGVDPVSVWRRSGKGMGWILVRCWVDLGSICGQSGGCLGGRSGVDLGWMRGRSLLGAGARCGVHAGSISGGSGDLGVDLGPSPQVQQLRQSDLWGRFADSDDERAVAKATSSTTLPAGRAAAFANAAAAAGAAGSGPGAPGAGGQADTRRKREASGKDSHVSVRADAQGCAHMRARACASRLPAGLAAMRVGGSAPDGVSLRAHWSCCVERSCMRPSRAHCECALRACARCVRACARMMRGCMRACRRAGGRACAP